VFWHSFEPGVASFGLDGVITKIGLRLFGTDFARRGSAERRDVVLRVLTEWRALLIWDNFETVRSMPDLTGATKPLDDDGGTALEEFLRHLAKYGRSSVLITSRAPEDWLGDMRRITVGGLASHEAVEYADNLFQDASTQVWVAALDDAARVGLLTSLSGGMYRIHPALPGYLATAWRREEPEDYDAVRDAAMRALVAAHSDFGSWLRQQIESADAGLAFAVIDLQRQTLGSLLGYALDHDLSDDAQAIAEPLDEYWRARGLDEEADAWADRARLAIEGLNGTYPPLDTRAGSLWLFFTSSQANRQLVRQHLDDAEHTYRQHLAALQAQPSSRQQQRRLRSQLQPARHGRPGPGAAG
jgi:hypothetical protein